MDPRRVDPRHRDEAVAMLRRHPDIYLADHQVPAHGRVTGGVGTSVSDLQGLQRLTPSKRRHLQISHRLTVVTDEDVIVIECAGRGEAFTQAKLPLQNLYCPRTQFHPPMLSGLGLVPIHAGDARLADADDAVFDVEVCEHERDLLGRAKAGE